MVPENFYLHGNELDGSIPSELGGLPSLGKLSFGLCLVEFKLVLFFSIISLLFCFALILWWMPCVHFFPTATILQGICGWKKTILTELSHQNWVDSQTCVSAPFTSTSATASLCWLNLICLVCFSPLIFVLLSLSLDLDLDCLHLHYFSNGLKQEFYGWKITVFLEVYLLKFAP